MNQSTCKACGAAIIWIQTPAGKHMPVDIGIRAYWSNPDWAHKIVTHKGEVVTCDLEGDANNSTGLGYTPHWATCTKAYKFKPAKAAKQVPYERQVELF